jgi:hypothetical protein
MPALIDAARAELAESEAAVTAACHEEAAAAAVPCRAVPCWGRSGRVRIEALLAEFGAAPG